jgi:hypothetical protein
MSAETGLHPPVLLFPKFEQPIPISGKMNTAGAEDSPIIEYRAEYSAACCGDEGGCFPRKIGGGTEEKVVVLDLPDSTRLFISFLRPIRRSRPNNSFPR